MTNVRVVPLAANNASAWTGPTGNITYLLPGPPAVLIDAGVGDARHIAAVSDALAGAPLDLVLITHGHVDHAAGVPALRRRWPQVSVRGGDSGAPLVDGELFDLADGALRAVHTPGHSPDHFCFHDSGSADLYCGDLMRPGGTVVIPASRGGSIADYLDSLERVRRLGARRALPAHGDPIDDPAALIASYVAHRLQREREVLAAWVDGIRDPAAIARRIYPGLAADLRRAAEDTVAAHLAKLAAEGRLAGASGD